MIRPIDPVRVGRPELDLPEYEWRGQCRIPGCEEPATDPHHIVARSQGGRYWLTIDGTPVPNVAGICRRHHDMIHQGQIGIVWSDRIRFWARQDEGGVERRLSPLYTRTTEEHPQRCPTCGRHWPSPRPWKIERRRKKQIQLKVPDDAENGEEIVRTLIALSAEKLKAKGLYIDNPDDPGVQYYALTAVLHDYVSGK